MRKPRDGQKALWHGHNVRKEEGKTGMYGDCPRPGFPGFPSRFPRFPVPNQEGNSSKRLPSSDEEGRRDSRRGWC